MDSLEPPLRGGRGRGVDSRGQRKRQLAESGMVFVLAARDNIQRRQGEAERHLALRPVILKQLLLAERQRAVLAKRIVEPAPGCALCLLLRRDVDAPGGGIAPLVIDVQHGARLRFPALTALRQEAPGIVHPAVRPQEQHVCGVGRHVDRQANRPSVIVELADAGRRAAHAQRGCVADDVVRRVGRDLHALEAANEVEHARAARCQRDGAERRQQQHGGQHCRKAPAHPGAPSPRRREHLSPQLRGDAHAAHALAQLPRNRFLFHASISPFSASPSSALARRRRVDTEFAGRWSVAAISRIFISS